ncbi:DASH complex subunit Dad1-domain-containing protein [Lipomyces oligophaga]|uniref:DASH complex subunit Dad1-domain-containing protein n=1 Tax=Lipomyces oligophaga TaxID=45792 RepID=UPI0034CF2EFD
MADENTPATSEQSYFEQQRAALVAEVAVSLEHVLANINTLNRALEGVIVVGKEFENVSSLWSTFYEGVAHVEAPGETSEDKENLPQEDAETDGDDQQ